MISLLLYSILIPIILYGVGIGATSLTLPATLKSYATWIAPWVGVVLIASIGIYGSSMGLPMNKTVYLILSVAMALLVTAIKKKKLLMPTKTDWLLGVFVLITFAFNIYPLLTKEQYPTTISMGNLDPISYTTVADFFTTQTIYDGKMYQAFSPYTWSIGDLVHHSYRWGTPMALSFFSTLFLVRAYVLFTVLITLLFALSLPLVWILIKILYPPSRIYLLVLVGAMYGINSTLLYMLYNVFFAQFMFSGLMLLTFILGVELAQSKKMGKNRLSTEILLALIFSGVSHIYPEGLLFVLLPYGLFVLFGAITKKSWTYIACWRVYLFAILFNPYTMYRGVWQLIQVVMRTSNLTWIGWEPIRYASLMEILGLYNLHYSRPLPMILMIISGTGIAFVLMTGFWRSRAKLFILSNLTIFALIYISTRYLGQNYYTYHRALTYTLFLYVVMFVIGAGIIIDWLRRPYFAAVIISGILLLSTRSALRTLQQFYYHHQTVDQALISLNDIPIGITTEPFFTDDMVVGEHNLWRRLWQEYMLRDHAIVSRQNYPTDFALTNTISLILSANDTVRENADRLSYKDILWENSFYTLGTLSSLEIDPALKDTP